MLCCIGHFPVWEGLYYMEINPQSSVQISATVNLTRAYTLAVQTPSFREIWAKIHLDTSFKQNVDATEVNFEEPLQIEGVLKPSRYDVKEALSEIKVDAFTEVVSDFFDQSEETAGKCLFLSDCLHHARHLCDPLQRLVDTFPFDIDGVAKYSQSQDECDSPLEVFRQFDKLENPFPSEDSHSIFKGMHDCYFQLKKQIDLWIENSRSKIHLSRHVTAICFFVAAIGVVTCVILIATPALVILFATPICPAIIPLMVTKKESTHLVQLDDISRETFVLDNYLETLDCLVDPLHNSVEDFKRDIRFVLERSMENYVIQEVLKQLLRRNKSFLEQLTCLEVHLCLCFTAINRARSILLNYLLVHQIRSS